MGDGDMKRSALSFFLIAGGLVLMTDIRANAQAPTDNTVKLPSADQAKIECLSLCSRILDVNMSAADEQKLRACVATVPRCLGGGGEALATRDTARDIMNGYRRPEAMFDLPRAFQRSPAFVDG
jgi:hypothetical protein